MADLEGDEAGGLSVDGVAIEQWNLCWDYVENGFTDVQSHLRHEVGLFAAKAGGEFMYIAKAVQSSNGGLRAGLSRAYVKNPSGDFGYGMQMLRNKSKELDAFVLRVPKTPGWPQTIEDLHKAMVSYHKPAWNQGGALIAVARAASYKDRSS